MILVGAILILAFLLTTSLLNLLYGLSGTWERISGTNQSIWDRERILLKQWGFLILGRQNLAGGFYKFLGIGVGPFVWLQRRDYGVQALVHEGFPENIAPLVEGRVLLRLSLRLSPDRLFLKGQAIPYKIEFYADGSGIKNIHAVEPILRSYRRAELTPVSEHKLAPVAKPAY